MSQTSSSKGDLRVGVGLDPFGGLAPEDFEPLDLVGHVFVVQGAAVRNVQAPDADAAAGGSYGAGLLGRVLAGFAESRLVHEGALNVVQAHTGGEGHTIPLGDAEVRDLVTHALKEFPGEVLVLALGLLDGQDIAVAALKPGFYAVGSGTEGVHIPGSYLHSN